MKAGVFDGPGCPTEADPGLPPPNIRLVPQLEEDINSIREQGEVFVFVDVARDMNACGAVREYQDVTILDKVLGRNADGFFLTPKKHFTVCS